MRALILAVPWRPSGSPDRDAAVTYVYSRAEQLEADDVWFVDADPLAPFSRGRSANMAFEGAAALGEDTVVIVNDADMILPEDSYYRAAEMARATGTLVVGFDDYRVLNRGMSQKVYAGADPFQLPFAHRLKGFSVGGVMAMTVKAWQEVGGFDPRFVGWGMEDWALAHASKLVLGPWTRLDGPGVHLFHPDEKNRWPAERLENERLHARYTACATAAEVRAIRAEVA